MLELVAKRLSRPGNAFMPLFDDSHRIFNLPFSAKVRSLTAGLLMYSSRFQLNILAQSCGLVL